MAVVLGVLGEGRSHGPRVLRVCGKGTKVVLIPLPPSVGRAIDRAVGGWSTGPILLNPDPSHLASMLQLLMQLNHATYRSIVEVRTAMEPMTSQLAAQRISDESLGELRLTVDQMRDFLDDRDSFLDSNKRFHDVIAWSSGNVLFSYIVDSLLDILDGTIIGIDYPRHRRVAILKAHEEIYTALARRDPQASLDRMREHIEAYATYAQRKFPEVLDQIITWDRQPG